MFERKQPSWSGRIDHPDSVTSDVSGQTSPCYRQNVHKRCELVRDAAEPRRPDALGRGAESAPGSPQHHQYIRDDASGNETSSVAELRLMHSITRDQSEFSSAAPTDLNRTSRHVVLLRSSRSHPGSNLSSVARRLLTGGIR